MDENVVQLRPHADIVPITQPGLTDITLALLRNNQGQGVTWREVAAVSGSGHGSASGVLSRLHKAGTVSRLSERRGRCYIYVLPEWVEERGTTRPSGSAHMALLDDMAAMLREVPAKCRHEFWRPRCRSCEIRLLLNRYDNR